jgi:hypothetical protein
MIHVRIVLITAILSTLIALLLLFSAAVPQWFFVTPGGITFGIQTECRGGSCGAISFNTWKALSTPICRSGAEWKNRMLVVEIFVWVSLVLGAIVAIVVGFAAAGKHVLEGRCKMATLTTASLSSAALGLMAIAIHAGTYASWLNCGSTFCELPYFTTRGYSTNCGFGASFIVFSFVCVLYLVVFLLLLLRWLNCLPNLARMMEYAMLGMLIVALAFTIASGVTNRWYVASTGEGIHVGLFQTCQDGCKTNADSIGPYIGGASCLHEKQDFLDRSNAVGALLIIGMFVMLAVAVAHFLRQFQCIRDPFSKVVRIILTAVVAFAGLLSFIAYILFSATYNSWLFCGETFCSTTGNCTYGFAFACGLIALILFAVLLILLVWDLIGCLDGSIRFTEPGAPVESEPYAHHSAKHVTTTTTSHTVTSSSRTEHHHTAPTAGGAGRGVNDWEFQEDSGYYWSDSRHLYWDKHTNQYYNPKTDVWSHAA